MVPPLPVDVVQHLNHLSAAVLQRNTIAAAAAAALKPGPTEHSASVDTGHPQSMGDCSCISDAAVRADWVHVTAKVSQLLFLKHI